MADEENPSFGCFDKNIKEQTQDAQNFGVLLTNDQPVMKFNDSAEHELKIFREKQKEKKKILESKEGKDAKESKK